MNVDLLLVPYDSAQRGERMGAGPAALADGVAERIMAHGHRVTRAVVEPPAGVWRAEIATTFQLAASLGQAVRASRAADRFPFVLTGNCGMSAGVVSALGADTTVIWADAHGDFNTPETTTGGFLDGMALATLTGRCWTKLAASIPGFTPVHEEQVWLLGARDLDPEESHALARSAIRHVRPEHVGAQLAESIVGRLPTGGGTYLHLDLDVIDRAEGRANGFDAPGGVSSEALAALCRALARTSPPRAVSLSAYDPRFDVDRRIHDVALRLVDALFERSG